MRYPLEGIKVIELAHVVAGPSAGQLLADLGADVVKIEPPAGDALRQWPPFAGEDSRTFSYNFASLNRNKRSMVADLKRETDLDRVKALCAEADVLVENYRPGVLDRLGLGFDAVKKGHRGIIYCSISGFGQELPYSTLGAFDVVTQAMSGVMSVTGDPDGPPVKCGVPIGDFVAGLYAALAVSAQLRAGGPARESVRIDVAMLDCLLAISALQVSDYWGNGITPARLGSRHPRNAPYQGFEAADGMFTLAAGNDKLWQEVCAATGSEHLLSDPRYASQTERAANQVELARALAPVFALKPVDFWLAEFARRGVPAGPVLTYEQVIEGSYVRDRRLLHSLPIPGGSTMPAVVFPARIGDLDQREEYPPPSLGEGAEDIWTSWTGRPA